ncbi:TOMM precursor leader peptide-binding protein [Streptomyces sp. NPDC059445]|uniref:TOMM precursor leader peptide-binding protein n=1 Tax=Streptomyces sp. NPDC059445 TaxID=3346832 RepID=UPI0036A76FFC
MITNQNPGFIVSPEYTVHDDGVDLCFYSVHRTKGTTLRGLAAVMTRSLLESAGGNGQLNPFEPATDDHGIGADRWQKLVDELHNRGILTTVGNQEASEPEQLQVRILGDSSERVESLADLVAEAILPSGLPVTHSTVAELREEGMAPAKGRQLVILASDGYDVPLHRQVNSLAISAGLPLLFVRALSTVIELGPFVLPGNGPCFECYWQRLQAPIAAEGPADWVRETPGRRYADVSWRATNARRIASHLTALEVGHIAGPLDAVPATMAKVGRFDPEHLSWSFRRVLEVPGCGHCRLANGVVR